MIGRATLLLLIAPLAIADDTPLTLAEELCRGYETIKTISCEIRKTSTGTGNTVRMLSRIHYKQNGFIHVDSLIRSDRTATVKRRIIADGKHLYYYQQRDRKGFSRPIPELKDPLLSTFKNVPGTPVEVLMKLKGTEETPLEGTASHPSRRAYQVKKVTVVLSCDKDGKPVKIEFFADPERQKKTAQYDYSNFQAAGKSWIPLVHKMTLFLPNGEQQVQTRRISNLETDHPISEQLFNAQLFFKDVEFTDDFKKTYSE